MNVVYFKTYIYFHFKFFGDWKNNKGFDLFPKESNPRYKKKISTLKNQFGYFKKPVVRIRTPNFSFLHQKINFVLTNEYTW